MKVESPVTSKKRTSSPTTVTASWSVARPPDCTQVHKHFMSKELCHIYIIYNKSTAQVIILIQRSDDVRDFGQIKCILHVDRNREHLHMRIL